MQSRTQSLTDLQGMPAGSGHGPRRGLTRWAAGACVWLMACLPGSVVQAQDYSADALIDPVPQPTSLLPLAFPTPALTSTDIPLYGVVRVEPLIPDSAYTRFYTRSLERRAIRALTMQSGRRQGGLSHPERIRSAPKHREPWFYLDHGLKAGPDLRSLLEEDFPSLMSPDDLAKFINLGWSAPGDAEADADVASLDLQPQPTDHDELLPADGSTSEDFLDQLWRREIERGYVDLRTGEFGAAQGHFESAQNLRGGTYEAILGLFHASLGMGHMSRASLQLKRLAVVAPKHFSSSFRPENLFDPPRVYLTQVGQLRNKINEGQVDASFLAVYSYVTWFGGNRPVALQVAQQPAVRSLVPRLWRIMEAASNGELVGQPTVTVPIEGLLSADAPEQPTVTQAPEPRAP